MAQKKQIAESSARKRELVAQLASARQSIAHSKEVLKDKLKPGKLARNIFTRRPKTIFAGSVLTSLVATLLIKRPKKPKRTSAQKTNKQILLTWLLSLLKPVAKVWLINLAKQLAENRLAQTPRPQKPRDGAAPQEQFFVQR